MGVGRGRGLGLPLEKALVLQVGVCLLCPEGVGGGGCILELQRVLAPFPVEQKKSTSESTPYPKLRAQTSPGGPANSLCPPGEEGLGVGGECQQSSFPVKSRPGSLCREVLGASGLELPSRGGKEEAVGILRRRV